MATIWACLRCKVELRDKESAQIHCCLSGEFTTSEVSPEEYCAKFGHLWKVMPFPYEFCEIEHRSGEDFSVPHTAYDHELACSVCLIRRRDYEVLVRGKPE